MIPRWGADAADCLHSEFLKEENEAHTDVACELSVLNLKGAMCSVSMTELVLTHTQVREMDAVKPLFLIKSTQILRWRRWNLYCAPERN